MHLKNNILLKLQSGLQLRKPLILMLTYNMPGISIRENIKT
jgi:hypothetical protein